MTQAADTATFTLPGDLDVQSAAEVRGNLLSAIETGGPVALEIDTAAPGQPALQLAFAAVSEARDLAVTLIPGPTLATLIDATIDDAGALA